MSPTCKRCGKPAVAHARNDGRPRSLLQHPAGGGNFSAELWERAKSTPGWNGLFSVGQGGWISPDFVDEAKATMDPSLYRQEFEASIESLLGAIYADFSRAHNVGPGRYDPNEPLLMGCDSTAIQCAPVWASSRARN